MSKPGECFLVMNGNTPISVYLDLSKAEKAAKDLEDGYVVNVPFRTG